MKKILFFVILCLIIGCGTRSTQRAVDVHGTVIEVDDARFVFPESSIVDTAVIRIERKSAARQKFDTDFQTSGIVFSITPDTVTFQRPVQFSMPASDAKAVLASAVGNGLVPIAGSRVVAETLTSEIHHGGEYHILSRPDRYGLHYTDKGVGLLVVCDLYVGKHVEKLKSVCRQYGYDLPIWTFVYPGENTIEENAVLLAEELKRMHDIHGKFRCDIVSFGIGGLIAHRYMNDTKLYNRDISSAVITVGTPFSGTNFADLDNAAAALNNDGFYYIDALGKHADELMPGSEAIEWIQKNSKLGGGYYYGDDIEENKNLASLRGISPQPGTFPEEYDGDGIVSLHSTLLTAIEPEPFTLKHFDLYENDRVLHRIVEFVKLYRSFNWPSLFSQVWGKKESYSRINEIWEQEARLMYGDFNCHILLEWNENMLKSAPQGALLVTNGDNDTYPAWFLQQQGVRNDVLIVNRSLLNVTEYVQFLMDQGLPLDISDAELSAITFKKSKDGVVTRSDQLIERLAQQEKRPLVLSTTVYNPERYGFPLTMVGMVYEIGEHGEKIDGTWLDVERTQKQLFRNFGYEKYLSTPEDSLSHIMVAMAANYVAVAHRLSMALVRLGRYEEAMESITFAGQFTDHSLVPFGKARIYTKMKKYETADSVLSSLLDQEELDISLRKAIAETYFEMGDVRKAIEILSDCLKQDPTSPDIPEMIKRYQKEL